MKKTIAMFLTLLLIFSVIPVPALADTVQTHNCHIHTTECYETQLTCGVAQHDHSAACCSIPEHTHSDSCSSFAPTSHVCSESTGCVTGGCDGKHHNDNCYVVIEPDGVTKCPASHFNADGTHKDIYCGNLPQTLLACLDPNHHEPSASCNGATSCVHTNCDSSCSVCFTAVDCTAIEHVDTLCCNAVYKPTSHVCSESTGCVTSGCDGKHHNDNCYVVIEPGGSGKCPASHFNADGTHRDISCSNLPTTVLACLDPNHHEPSASCNGVTICVHTNCDNSCPVCFTAVDCTISEHTHGVACDTSACSDAHHTDACYEDVLICGKEEVACTPEHCPYLLHVYDAKETGDGEIFAMLAGTTNAEKIVAVCVGYDLYGKQVYLDLSNIPVQDGKCSPHKLSFLNEKKNAVEYQIMIVDEHTWIPLVDVASVK